MNWVIIRALLTICCRQGILRKTRCQFWFNLWNMWRYNSGGVSSYLSVCSQIEHFVEYRQIVKQEIEQQVAQFLAATENASLTEQLKIPYPVRNPTDYGKAALTTNGS